MRLLDCGFIHSVRLDARCDEPHHGERRFGALSVACSPRRVSADFHTRLRTTFSPFSWIGLRVDPYRAADAVSARCGRLCCASRFELDPHWTAPPVALRRRIVVPHKTGGEQAGAGAVR